MRIKPAVLVGVLALVPVLVVPPAQALATSCKGLPATIIGTAGDDELTGTPLPDVVALGGGDDEFSDLGGNDVICGGGGNDAIDGGPGNDYIDGGAGNDQISGGADADRIIGGTGKAADYIAGGAGNDKLSGGPGTDYLTYLFWDQPIKVRNARVIDGAGHDVAASIETIEGTSLADVMRGSAGDDDLRGGSGKDRIYGLGGNDILFANGGTARGGAGIDYIQATGRTTALGGADSDEIVLGKGPVRALGGAAPDTFRVISNAATGSVDGGGAANQLNFSSHRRAIRLDVGAGKATWRGGRLTLRNIDNVLGTVRNDLMIGSAGNDYMDGFRGGDTLRGKGGNDFLIGKGGFDRADGGPGWDICLTERRTRCP